MSHEETSEENPSVWAWEPERTEKQTEERLLQIAPEREPTDSLSGLVAVLVYPYSTYATQVG